MTNQIIRLAKLDPSTNQITWWRCERLSITLLQLFKELKSLHKKSNTAEHQHNIDHMQYGTCEVCHAPAVLNVVNTAFSCER